VSRSPRGPYSYVRVPGVWLAEGAVLAASPYEHVDEVEFDARSGLARTFGTVFDATDLAVGSYVLTDVNTLLD
jgi:hypothetical protein